MSQGKRVVWTLEMDALLGTMSEKEVARRLGLNPATAFYRREELGIPSFGAPNTQWTPEMEDLLGTMSDAKVADELGIRKGVVRRHRNKLGIPSWKSKNRVLPLGMRRESPEGERFHARRRRHKIRGLLDTLTCEEWERACKFFGHRCAYCGKNRFLTEDHLVPLSKEGPRTALNIIPACWECNFSKCDQRAHIWIYKKFGMEEGQKIVDRIVAYLKEVT